MFEVFHEKFATKWKRDNSLKLMTELKEKNEKLNSSDNLFKKNDNFPNDA